MNIQISIELILESQLNDMNPSYSSRQMILTNHKKPPKLPVE